ncbi:MAG: transporter substrate-binding domain-containing protein [Oscillospiraceae bacterium]
MKKIIALTLIALMAMSLAACGGKPEESKPQDSASPSPAAQTDKKPIDVEYHSVEAIKARGVLSVATESQYAPFCFKSDKGEIIGLEQDFLKAYAEYFGVSLDLQYMAFDSVVPSAQSGIVDMGMAGLTPDAERKKAVDFSDFYYTGGQNLIIKADKLDTYTTIESLDGKSIGAQKGSTQQKIAESQFPKATMSLMPKIPMLVIDLQNGNLDGVLADKVTAEQYVKLNKDLALAKVEIKVEEEENGSSIAVMKGNSDLTKSLNEFIKAKTDDGSIGKWYVSAKEIADTLGVE